MFHVQIEVLEQLSEHTLLYGDLNGTAITAKLDRNTALTVGQSLPLTVEPQSLHFFDRDGGRI